VPAEMIEKVVYMIECTEKHNNPKKDESTQVFLDADMAIIGASEDVYVRYTDKIKNEFANVPSILYQQGRKRFIENTLKAERIYQSDYFFDRYERQARLNLYNELSSQNS
jgi:predicted metal-dependent HD superfamily phosphohydrolase